MKLIRKAGATSEIWQIFIADSSSIVGAGLTGLTNASGSLTAYYHRDTDTTATAISLVSMTVGTFTSSGFKEIDATNMPGWYQFCPPNAAIAAGAKSCAFLLKGAANMAPLPIEVDLWAVDPQAATNFGLTALPTVAAGASNGILISGSNSGTTTLGALTVTGATTCTGNVSMAAGLNITQSSANTSALVVTGNGTGHGAVITSGSGATGDGVQMTSNATNGNGLVTTGKGSGNGTKIVSVSGDALATSVSTSGHGATFAGTGTTKHGINATGGATTSAGIAATGGGTSGAGILVRTTSGHGVDIAATGTSMHGITTTGGNGGTSDGFKAVAGTGGVPIRGDITGNITGNLSGSAGSVTGLTASNLDVAVSSRMATYAQPTGFLTATFPATVASTTNITAGTITTVTNLTNAPTVGDFTATMKTSLNSATPAVTVSDKTGFSLTAAYDPAKTASQAGDAMTLTGAYDFAKGTTTMTESYAAQGAAMTPVQALYQINQHLGESSIVTTTKTVKKRDGATTAKTFTLDSATTPTSITEAT